MKEIAWGCGFLSLSLWVEGHLCPEPCSSPVSSQVQASWEPRPHLPQELHHFLYWERVQKKKKKMRYGECGLWHQMSEKKLFCTFALEGAAMLLSETCSKSSGWPGRWFSILAAHAHQLGWFTNPKALGPQPRLIKSGWGRERECEHHTR